MALRASVFAIWPSLMALARIYNDMTRGLGASRWCMPMIDMILRRQRYIRLHVRVQSAARRPDVGGSSLPRDLSRDMPRKLAETENHRRRLSVRCVGCALCDDSQRNVPPIRCLSAVPQ